MKADGSTEVMLGLTKSMRADTFGPLANRSCQWVDKKGASHDVKGTNCFTPLPWFSPGVLPLLLSEPGIAVTDGGEVTEGGLVRHRLKTAG